MKKPYFNITARCERCGEFTVQRKKKIYVGSDDHEHIIEKLVCPDCRMHADITKIESAG